MGKRRISSLLGTSGSGKTVILNSLLGIFKKYKGKITVDSIKRKPPKYPKSNRIIGYYTQMEFALQDISVYNSLKDSCIVMGVKNNKVNEKVKYWMQFSMFENIIRKRLRIFHEKWKIEWI
ncbi:ATP-binding cassette domain-containing protein [Spiroplasma endosymbiont of Cantharis rufa]|uniref:ATP-binding cassette domain-containing protein n=1 Tax=Spiroplasma endosymbiont of Cantharis rufa TaxID=3066279 RepID=UPI003BB0A260